MSKIKFRLEVWGSTVLFQVLEMDERFRCNNENPFLEHTAKNGICVYSEDIPFLALSSASIYLRGRNICGDEYVSCSRQETDSEAYEFAQKIIEALKDWAENWEGWIEDEKNEEELQGKVYEF